jgi:hypothetical protein
MCCVELWFVCGRWYQKKLIGSEYNDCGGTESVCLSLRRLQRAIDKSNELTE